MYGKVQLNPTIVTWDMDNYLSISTIRDNFEHWESNPYRSYIMYWYKRRGPNEAFRTWTLVCKEHKNGWYRLQNGICPKWWPPLNFQCDIVRYCIIRFEWLFFLKWKIVVLALILVISNIFVNLTIFELHFKKCIWTEIILLFNISVTHI